MFTSERALVEAGKLAAGLDRLAAKGLIYTGVLEPPKGKKPEDWEPREQTLFRSTDFGDDVDRPLKKSDGSWTYFAGDIANHLDKIERGFGTLINVWGADHGGHVKRMKAAVTALSGGAVELDVRLCQLVKLLRHGEPVKMSKRAGSFVTIRDVVDEVGKDVLRFIMLTRKNDAPLDFDLVRVTEQSRDNPVFYVQYAHARVHSVLRNAAEAMPGLDVDCVGLSGSDLGYLTDDAELALIRRLAGWPRQVESAAEAHEPHRLAFYLHDLAAAFHGLWNKGNEDPRLRFIVGDDDALTRARLAMIRAVGLVIASGLDVDCAGLSGSDLGYLTDDAELALIRRLAGWPRQVESAAEAHEPHRLAFYLHDLAAAFHGLWNKGNEDPRLRFIVGDDDALTRARLAMIRAVGLVIASGLEIFGVEPVEEMR